MPGPYGQSALDRWLGESVDDQPFNTVAFVQQASTPSKSAKASKSLSSLGHITPSELLPKGDVKS